MSELEPHTSWEGLPTVSGEQHLPIPPDTLSDTERQTIAEAAEGVLLDIEHPSAFPQARDIFVDEAPHPTDTSTQ